MTLTKINHTFTYPQLSYDATPNIQPCIKLSFYFNKLPEVSYEQFYGHWSTVHADLTVAAKGFGLCKIQRYVQLGQTPEFKQKASQLTGIKMLEFDGCSEIWVKTWDDWMAFFKSEEYAQAMNPDCKYFMAMPISVYCGEENVVFGEGVKDMAGKDGILEGDYKRAQEKAKVDEGISMKNE
ncbi:EthD domain-containing protein [Tricladium varicosporioides]|nr:EthD domain-containing protein [Hymenoscyphus varicosporioides]